jgi:hypothetical protein
MPKTASPPGLATDHHLKIGITAVEVNMDKRKAEKF